MIRRCRSTIVLLLICLVICSGCRPTQPFFLHEDGDLSHLLQTANELEYPDVDYAHNAEAAQSCAPLTISNLHVAEYVDLSLEDVVSITLQNSKIIRNLGGVTQRGFADPLVGSTTGATSVYDVALQESALGSRSEQLSPSLDGAATAAQAGGIESALSQFDAQFELLSGLGGSNASLWSKSDRPQNIVPNPGVAFFAPTLDQDTSNVTAQLRKRTATGTTFIARSTTSYERGNSRGGVFNRDGTINPNRNQALNSFWTQGLEVEIVHPLLRGSGTFINRIPVMLARMNSDITQASFEGSVRNLMMDVENTYWDLHCAYLAVETQRLSFDTAHATWKIINARLQQGKENAQAEAQAREQYLFFRSQMETSLRRVLDLESNLRFLMGIAPTDGRVIRPSDTPTVARVTFEWEAIRAEALCRSPELRQQKWAIKQRELELASAKNQLMPRVDIRGIYRWIGSGDNLIEADRNGIPFPNDGSTAFEELTGGSFQELSIGVDYVPARIGKRRELAAVRNAQLQIARAHASLDDAELNVLTNLTAAIRNLDANYVIAQTQMNRFNTANREVTTAQAQYVGGRSQPNLVLQAQERRARAQLDYYTSICEYNKAIANVHFIKGSLMELNNVCLAEGPWPKKAYWDAHERARERDASIYLDYGSTRPSVVSRGPIAQHQGTVHRPSIGDIYGPSPASEMIEPRPTEEVPVPAPTPTPNLENAPKPPSGPVAMNTKQRRPTQSVLRTGAIGSAAAAEPTGTTNKVVPAAATRPIKASYDWGKGRAATKTPAPRSKKKSALRNTPTKRPRTRTTSDANNPLRGESSGSQRVSLR